MVILLVVLVVEQVITGSSSRTTSASGLNIFSEKPPRMERLGGFYSQSMSFPYAILIGTSPTKKFGKIKILKFQSAGTSFHLSERNFTSLKISRGSPWGEKKK